MGLVPYWCKDIEVSALHAGARLTRIGGIAMSYDERMAAILKADEARRNLRAIAEASLIKSSDTDYCESRNLTGQPTEKNRLYRASDDCWKRGLKRDRTVGTADGKDLSVKVTRHGKSEIVSARGFGRKSISAKSAQHRATRAASDRQLMLSMTSNHEGDV